MAVAFWSAARLRRRRRTPQALRQEIDQLRRDFDALKQQYGDRLSALEAKLAAAEGDAPRRSAAGAAALPQASRPPPGAAGRGRRRRPDRRAARLRRPRRRARRCSTRTWPSSATSSAPPARNRASTRAAGARDARVGSVVPGGRRSLRARRLLHLVRRGRRRSRGRLRHVHVAARRAADEGRQDARGVRQGQHAAQPRAAVGRSAARHQQPRRRRRRHRRRGHLGGAADSEPVDVPRSDRPGVPRRLRATSIRSSRRASAASSATSATCAAYQDITESTQHRPRVSRTSRGHNAAGIVDGVDVGRFTTQLYGVDATLRWKPLQRSIYHSFVGRTEVDLEPARSARRPAERHRAMYVSGDYQFARRWFAGVRYDRSDRADDASLRRHGRVVACSPTGRASSARCAASTGAPTTRSGRRPTSSCSSSSSRSARTARIRSKVGQVRQAFRGRMKGSMKTHQSSLRCCVAALLAAIRSARRAS